MFDFRHGRVYSASTTGTKREAEMKYIIVTFAVEQEGEYYVSRCRELGTASFGSTEQEAVENLSDATQEYLNTLQELGECAQVLRQKKVPVRHKAAPVVCRPEARSWVIPLRSGRPETLYA